MFEIIGKILCYIGGIGIAIVLIIVVFILVFALWVYVREIATKVYCAESLILTYKKHRKEIDEIIREKGKVL